MNTSVLGSDVFDLLILLALFCFFLRGFIRGFIEEVAGIIAVVGGFAAANALHPKLSPYMRFIGNPTIRTILTYAIIFITVLLLVSVVARFLKKIRDLSFTAWIDRLAGGVFGLAKGLFLCSLLILVLQAIFRNAPFLEHSHTIPYLTTLMEHLRSWLPDDLAKQLGLPLHQA